MAGGDGRLTGPEVTSVFLKLQKERVWGEPTDPEFPCGGHKEAGPEEALLVRMILS